MTSPPPSSSRSYGLIGAIAVVLIVLVALFAFRSDGADSAEISNEGTTQTIFANGSGTLAIGDPAWEFDTVDINGNPVALSDFAGQPIIINYWASWCGPCRIEFPHLQEAYEQYQDEGVVLLAVNQQEDAATAIDYFRELGLSFTPVLDEDGEIGKQYQIGRTLPTTFFINPAGEVAAVHRGPMTFGQIEGYLADTMGRNAE
ncbi:MAG: TlpA family protein disulfide reductase [Candidatus Promineifilaceae bacterium]